MGDYRTSIPVWVVFLLLANILLVMALEVLLLYRMPLPLTQEVLAEADSRFDGAVLSQSQQRGYLHCALAETSGGDIYLIPIRAHGILPNRGRLLEKQILPLKKNADTSVNVKIGVYTSTLSVSPTPPRWLEDPPQEALYLSIDHSSAASGSSMAMQYLVLGAAMTLLELFVLRLIKGNQ